MLLPLKTIRLILNSVGCRKSAHCIINIANGTNCRFRSKTRVNRDKRSERISAAQLCRRSVEKERRYLK